MPTRIRHITVDCAPPHEPYEIAQFWSQVLGQPVDPEDDPEDDEICLVAPEGEPALLFVRVPDDKTVKNRIHFDLGPEQGRDPEVERLTALGAKLIDDRRKPDGRGWAVMTDPAGNEFCVEGNDEEQARAEQLWRAEQEAKKQAERSSGQEGTPPQS